MYCIAITDSGNYALMLCNLLREKGYNFEVAPTPCRLARGGCSYCLKFPQEFTELILKEASVARIAIREIYKVDPANSSNKYAKLL